MNYKRKINTPAYNSLMSYRWGGKYKPGGIKKYAPGGMYEPNTVAGAGQGTGETSNIVYQESNPQVLQAKMQAMESEKQRLLNEADMTQQEVEQMEANTDQIGAEAAASVGSKGEQIASTGKEIISQADKLTDGALGDFAKTTGEKLFGKGTEQASSSLLGEGYKLGDLSGKSLGQLSGTPGIGSGGINNFSLLDKSSSLFQPTPNFSSGLTLPGGGTSGLNLGSSGTSSLSLPGSTPSFSAPTLGGSPTFNLQAPKLDMLTNNKMSLLSEGTKTLGQEALKETGKQGFKKAMMSTSGVGTSGVGTGLGKFATSGAGIGTIASLAGMGVSALSDDKDATKLNFGEGAGATLSGIGTGLGAAALAGTVMGSAVPLVGNVVGAALGAAYGLGKALIGRKKARKAKKMQEAKIKQAKEEHNLNLTKRMGLQNAIVRSGELEQKTYSGYDLGKNVTYRLGGKMQPLMKYA